MLVENKPYGYITICDNCNLPVDEDDMFDYRERYVTHVCYHCVQDIPHTLGIDEPFPSFQVYHNPLYKENWREIFAEFEANCLVDDLASVNQ